LGIIPLLDGRIKCIHVDMDNFSHSHVETIINFRAPPGKNTSPVGCGFGAWGVICRGRAVVDETWKLSPIYLTAAAYGAGGGVHRAGADRRCR
jgi:hypothetical protein